MLNPNNGLNKDLFFLSDKTQSKLNTVNVAVVFLFFQGAFLCLVAISLCTIPMVYVHAVFVCSIVAKLVVVRQ